MLDLDSDSDLRLRKNIDKQSAFFNYADFLTREKQPKCYTSVENQTLNQYFNALYLLHIIWLANKLQNS